MEKGRPLPRKNWYSLLNYRAETSRVSARWETAKKKKLEQEGDYQWRSGKRVR